MLALRTVRFCIAAALAVAGLFWPTIAPAFDADSATKPPSAVEAQNQNSLGDKPGTLPGNRSAFRTPSSAPKGAAAEPSGKPRMTPAKETTYILQPLREDGFPDYFAAMNEHCRGALEPENNVAVLLLQAFGPAAIPAEIQDEYFHLLGNKFQRPVGSYFVRMDEMIQRWIKGMPRHVFGADREDELQTQFAVATQQLWSRSDLPLVAEWLAINEIPLKKIADASRRPRFYEPIVAANRRVPARWSASLPMEPFISEMATAFEARAMFHAGSNEFEPASEDLLTCHRILRKLAGYPIGQYAIEARTAEIGLIQTELKLLHHCHPSPQQMIRFRKLWAELPPLLGIIDRIDLGIVSGFLMRYAC